MTKYACEGSREPFSWNTIDALLLAYDFSPLEANVSLLLAVEPYF